MVAITIKELEAIAKAKGVPVFVVLDEMVNTLTPTLN